MATDTHVVNQIAETEIYDEMTKPRQPAVPAGDTAVPTDLAGYRRHQAARVERTNAR